MSTPDVFVPFTATMPKRLLAAIDKRASSLGLARAAHLANLARADLAGAGIEPPAPPPPKHSGPKPKKKPAARAGLGQGGGPA